MPEIKPDDETQTLYVKAIRKTAVRELKKLAIDGQCGVGELIERMLQAYASTGQKP